MLANVIWRSFWHRDERGILIPYWRLPHRQAFHDGVCAALLLVAVRRALNKNTDDCPVKCPPEKTFREDAPTSCLTPERPCG